ncbi:ALG3 protein [Ditylenchus destructor]|nr:ALG3 protein [Ditylenchus destructor]
MRRRHTLSTSSNPSSATERRNVLNNVISTVALSILTVNRDGFLRIAFLLGCIEAFLSFQIIENVPYTEIDWETYMQQVKVYINGERNYTKIEGPTGPIVYPAGHFISVSVKMNLLLFAPAVFFILLISTNLRRTIWLLTVCAIVQVAIAWNFLTYDPIAYFKRAFELSRVFMFKWTVNWRFLPEELFLDKRFHLFLLLLHDWIRTTFFMRSSRQTFWVYVSRDRYIISFIFGITIRLPICYSQQFSRRLLPMMSRKIGTNRYSRSFPYIVLFSG